MTLKSAPILALALAACSQPQADGEEASPAPDAEAVGEPGAQLAEAAQPAESNRPDPPEKFLRTAWRVVGEDGARYTTYLDEEGTYRDLKNGEMWQSGTWTRSEGDASICLTPDVEDAGTMCWTPVRMDGERAMIVESDAQRTVRLERVDYRFPDAE